jgi:hypothetical protein
LLHILWTSRRSTSKSIESFFWRPEQRALTKNVPLIKI